MTAGIDFLKGHGTENDFVLVPDLDDALDISPNLVRALCDRRAGIGGDGLIRIVRGDSGFFMDYRNRDGSTAEMCGNGARVFVRYLVDAGLVAPGRFAIMTAMGEVDVVADAQGPVTIAMGRATTPLARAMPMVSVDGRSWPAVGVLVPNPHAVVFVDDLAEAGSLLDPPEVLPAAVFPEGVNVEFVVDRGPGHVAMRVHERGSGETRSCGTGACAVAWAARRRDGADASSTYRVDVPGGRLDVTERADGVLDLRGPAEIVAAGRIDHAWWQRHA